MLISPPFVELLFISRAFISSASFSNFVIYLLAERSSLLLEIINESNSDCKDSTWESKPLLLADFSKLSSLAWDLWSSAFRASEYCFSLVPQSCSKDNESSSFRILSLIVDISSSFDVSLSTTLTDWVASTLPDESRSNWKSDVTEGTFLFGLWLLLIASSLLSISSLGRPTIALELSLEPFACNLEISVCSLRVCSHDRSNSDVLSCSNDSNSVTRFVNSLSSFSTFTLTVLRFSSFNLNDRFSFNKILTKSSRSLNSLTLSSLTWILLNSSLIAVAISPVVDVLTILQYTDYSIKYIRNGITKLSFTTLITYCNTNLHIPFDNAIP